MKQPPMTAEDWDRRFASSERLFSQDPNPSLGELVSGLEPGRALDLGAGEGRHAVWLAQRGWRVTAVDFSRVGLERAAETARKRRVEIDCVLADVVRDYRPAPRGFELVVIAYLHPEAAARAALFGSAAEAVAPRGHLFVTGRDLADLGRVGRGPSDPDRRYTPSRLSGAFPGIELSRCESVSREIEGEEGTQEAIDTLAWGYRPAGRERSAPVHRTHEEEG